MMNIQVETASWDTSKTNSRPEKQSTAKDSSIQEMSELSTRMALWLSLAE
jgi:hypothetical protein